MASVYLLSEDDSDDQAYLYVLEVLLRVGVDLVPWRLRTGGGIGEVRRNLPLLLDHIRHTGPLDGVFFVVAMDNDREPEHASPDCRHCSVLDAVHKSLPDGWPIPGAVAVPVQMLESWLLLMHDPAKYPDEGRLPRFARRSQSLVIRALGSNAPPQLKDLVDIERGSTSKDDFALACVLKLDADNLAARARSFRLFRDQVSTWRA